MGKGQGTGKRQSPQNKKEVMFMTGVLCLLKGKKSIGAIRGRGNLTLFSFTVLDKLLLLLHSQL